MTAVSPKAGVGRATLSAVGASRQGRQYSRRATPAALLLLAGRQSASTRVGRMTRRRWKSVTGWLRRS